MAALSPNLKIKVVVRQLPGILAVPHRVYHYDPVELEQQGICGPDEHVLRIIEDDIIAFQMTNPEFRQALFMTYDMDGLEAVLII